MAFVNALMLAGVAAIAIPIIIQLLTRRHQRTVPWGAMRFLQDAVRKRRRKVLLEDILLLVCRCLLPALAALALARPFVTPGSRVPWVVVLPVMLVAIALFGVSFALWRYPKARFVSFALATALAALSALAVAFERKLNLSRFGGGADKDVAVIVDGSSSMSMVGSDGKSNFDRALEEAGKYLEEAPRSTAFAFIVGGPVPEVLNPVPVSDRRVLRETLRGMQPSQGTMRATPALAAAAMTLAGGNNPVKQIVVLGDGQAVGWDLHSRGRWETIRSLFSRLREPVVAWRTLPLPASIRNLAVSSVSLSREPVGTDREVQVRVTVLNSGTEAVTPEEVTLQIGAKTVKAGDMRQLEPGASQTFSFPHSFERPGSAIVSATVSARDDLPADDTFRLVVPVVDTLRVLVVDGDGSGPALSRGSTYVSLALRPELAGRGADRAGYLLETTVEDVSRAASRTDFSPFAAVALCNVPRLSDAAFSRLGDYVRGGGGLLVLPGAKTKAAPLNAWKSVGEPVMPAPLAAWKAVAAGDEASAPHLDPSTFALEALRQLRTGTDLSGASALARWTFEDVPSARTCAVAWFDDGTPALLSKSVGRGTVAVSAVPFDDTASDLVSRRGFVPYAHQIVYHLARPVSPELNIAPSDGATLLMSPAFAVPPGDSASGGRHGLLGRFFPRKGFTGDARIVTGKPVQNMSWHWGGGAPLPDFPSENFSVVWSGTVEAPETGTYAFSVSGDDRIWLFVDGKLVARSPAGDGVSNSARIEMEAGKARQFEVRYEEDWGVAEVVVSWTRPDGVKEPVPASALRPDTAQVVEAVDPRGESFLVQLESGDIGTQLRVSRPLIPGLYTVKPPGGGFPPSMASAVSPEGEIRFSVAAGTDESRLLAVTPEEADALREFVALTLATKPEDVFSLLHGSAFGKEIWRVFAFAALLLVVAEVALARWISIQRREGEETNVDFTNEGEMGRASFKEALAKLGRGAGPPQPS